MISPLQNGTVISGTRSRVRKSPLTLYGRGAWVASHPVMGSRVFDAWNEAMDWATARCTMMNYGLLRAHLSA